LAGGGGGLVSVPDPVSVGAGSVTPVSVGAAPVPEGPEGTGPAEVGSSAPQLAARSPSEAEAARTTRMNARRVFMRTPSRRLTGLMLDAPRNGPLTIA
jgi:hypothetical protein